MNITVATGPRRPKPQLGDKKLIKGIPHVRVFDRVTWGPHKGAVVCSNGRPRYKWIPL